MMKKIKEYKKSGEPGKQLNYRQVQPLFFKLFFEWMYDK